VSDVFKVLMLGDVIGDSGIAALKQKLPALIADTGVLLVVANGENAADGFGLTRETADAMFSAGVDCITGGNHVWEKKGSAELLDGDSRILRPLNYPQGAPGRGLFSLEKGGVIWHVFNVQGREGMTPIDSPFARMDEALGELAPGAQDHGAMIIVDFHAEAFQEKEALALYLDGRVSVVAGTHTHIQTADERILPKGTGYIGDLGMCGPVDSIIGVRVEGCIRRNITQMPIKMEVADGPSMMNGAVFSLDHEGACIGIQRIRLDAD
jgi:2',3'-cyclic-nucleotide 2'-phosphodiesterase